MRRRVTTEVAGLAVLPHPGVGFLILFACGYLLDVSDAMSGGRAVPPTVVTLSPNPGPGPFLSGQLVKVSVAPNTVLRPGAHLGSKSAVPLR